MALEPDTRVLAFALLSAPVAARAAGALPALRAPRVDLVASLKMSAQNCVVTPGYFDTMGMRLHRGRQFTEYDREQTPPVVIINQELAERHWKGQDPEGILLSALGASLGLAGAAAGTRAMSSLLCGVSSTDPVIFACVPLALVAAAVVACYAPARRSASVDPIDALRCE
jgi:hypothetical protein